MRLLVSLVREALPVLAALLVTGVPAQAQAPLVTDDAAVASLRVLHLELFGQFARLPATALPATGQTTTVLTAGWGVTPRLEIGFDFPLIGIHLPGPDTRGFGDLNLTAKYLLRTPTDTTAPRWALGVAAELPTGDVARGLGSGVADFGLTLIREQRFRRAVVRSNLGIQASGNTLTGLVGTRNRAPVLNAGVSVTHPLRGPLTLAMELTGYQGRSPSAADREIRLQSALLCSIATRHAVAVSLQRGWLATPPVSVQVGLVMDAW